jgi:hypothetical protein
MTELMWTCGEGSNGKGKFPTIRQYALIEQDIDWHVERYGNDGIAVADLARAQHHSLQTGADTGFRHGVGDICYFHFFFWQRHSSKGGVLWLYD